MIGVGRFLRSRFLNRLIQRDAGNEPRPQEAANVQFSHRLLLARPGDKKLSRAVMARVGAQTG